MKPNTLDEAIEILKWMKETGKKPEVFLPVSKVWILNKGSWPIFYEYTYRIPPEPKKPRKCWVRFCKGEEVQCRIGEPTNKTGWIEVQEPIA